MKANSNFKFAIILLTLFSLNAHAAPSAQEMVAAADRYRGLQGSFSMQVKTLVQDESEKTEQVYSVKVRDHETSLVEQVSPARAQGRKLLMKGLDMWLFTLQVKKPVRISLQQRLTGDIANGDISRTNYSEDYEAQVVGVDKALKASVLELSAKDNKVTYSKIKYWIEQPSQKPLKAEFYALSGKLLKQAVFSDFKKIENHERMTKVTITDAVMPTKKSILIYSKQKSQKFQDSLFNKEQMDR